MKRQRLPATQVSADGVYAESGQYRLVNVLVANYARACQDFAPVLLLDLQYQRFLFDRIVAPDDHFDLKGKNAIEVSGDISYRQHFKKQDY